MIVLVQKILVQYGTHYNIVLYIIVNCVARFRQENIFNPATSTWHLLFVEKNHLKGTWLVVEPPTPLKLI